MEHPEVPLERSQEDILHQVHASTESWIMGVALTAALLALMVEHHADEAMILQIQSSDQWNYFQAKSIKSSLLATKTELLTALGKTVEEKDVKKLEEYKKEQEEIKDAAEHIHAATMIYQAMFDEMDEGTAIFKCTNSPPVGASPFLTYEGLPSDHYLWLTGMGSRLLREEMEPSEEVPQRK